MEGSRLKSYVCLKLVLVAGGRLLVARGPLHRASKMFS